MKGMEQSFDLNPVDQLILLLLKAKQAEPIPGPLFLQKEAYALRSADTQLKTDLGFEPHLLGPFSDALAAEIEQLELSGLMQSVSSGYKLTAEGSHQAELIAAESKRELLIAVDQTKELLNDLSRDELLALIYFGSQDEEFEAESIEYKRIARDRVRLARILLRKDKVSVSKAAEIAGVGVDEIVSGGDNSRR